MATMLQQAIDFTFNNEKRDAEKIHSGFETAYEHVHTAAEALQDSGFVDDADECKIKTKELLELAQKVAAQAEALAKMAGAYNPPESENEEIETDFGAKFDESLRQCTSNSFNPEQEGVYRDLEEMLNKKRGLEANENGGDEDLRMEGGDELAPNKKCPLCAKLLLDLDSPVEDQRGFVYEEEIIKNHIRQHPQKQVDCPVAGATHRIQLSNLRPARKVIRAKKNAKKNPTQTQANDDDDDILDVV